MNILPQTAKMKLVNWLPPWKTWWAYTIYFILLVGIAYYFYKVAKNRIALKNLVHLKEIERSKSEELNHAKLQFFTNITHELLTPLTIISATVDELKMQSPQHTDLYGFVGRIRRSRRIRRQEPNAGCVSGFTTLPGVLSRLS